MQGRTVLTILAALLLQAPAPAICTYDRAAILALDEQAFDQAMTSGWRTLAKAGCGGKAADLIHDGRQAHPGLRRPYLSFRHEGQLRADAGQADAAAALFGQPYRMSVEDKIGWNHSVDGSIVFLRRDRPAVDAAGAGLAAVPKPEDFGPDGKPVAVAWPMNLNVLDGFRRCRGRAYKEVYGPTCAAPVRRVTSPAR